MSVDVNTTLVSVFTSSTPVAGNETFNMTRFLVLESTVAIFTVILCYLTLAFAIYDCRKPIRRQMGSIRKPGAGRSNHYATAMRVESITAASFLLGRFICEHYELLAQYTGAYAMDYCNIVVKLKVALSSVSVTGIYVFLWTRQRFCYSDPAMEHLTTQTTKVLSWFSLVLLFVAQVVGTILFTTTRFYKLTLRGCYNYRTTIPPYIPWIWLAGATVIFQFLLFGLFVYPLLKHSSTLGSNSSRRRSKDFLPIIKRATITATLCIISDTISSLLILLVVDSNDIIPTLAYDVSVLINIICILAAFRDWKPRLLSPFPCCALTETTDITRLTGRTTRKESSTQKYVKRTNQVWAISSATEESPPAYECHVNDVVSSNNDSVI